jgi:23S rRNA (uracil1939-C5)-methyltransferase
VKNYDPVTITIDQLDPAGYGLSADGKQGVIGALAGETVIAVPWARKRKKHFFKTDTVSQASADRVTPICPSANDCGGCSFQHFESVAQIRFKADNLQETLSATPPLLFMEPITGPTHDYRSKARLGVKFVEKKGRVLVGFREKMKPYVAEIDRCFVLRASVGENLSALAQVIGELSDPRSVPQIEVAVGDTETALVIRHLGELTASDLSQLSEFGRQLHFDIYLQPGNESTVHKLFPADGVERLKYSLPEFDLIYAFHPMDFTQVNHQINQKMIRRAIDWLALKDTDRVLDGFCGIGNFSLPLARTAGYVKGVELSQTCVQRANENAALNQLSNVEFAARDLFAENQDKTEFLGYNKVLLDPPRSGALEVCKILATHQAERVVYVSCNPVTLARDAEILVAGGYRFESAGVIDMFPHTTHVESIACFTRP